LERALRAKGLAQADGVGAEAAIGPRCVPCRLKINGLPLIQLAPDHKAVAGGNKKT